MILIWERSTYWLQGKEKVPKLKNSRRKTLLDCPDDLLSPLHWEISVSAWNTSANVVVLAAMIEFGSIIVPNISSDSQI